MQETIDDRLEPIAAVVATPETLSSPLLLGSLGNGFNIAVTDPSKGSVEIIGTGIRQDERFSILCAWPDHPYCLLAEDNFLVEQLANDDTSPNAPFKNQTVSAFLRNNQTRLVEETSFTADVLIKRFGVHSGIVTNPPELHGLMCAPLYKDHWVVFRPFNLQHVGKSKSKVDDCNFDLSYVGIPSHISGLPRIANPSVNLAAMVPPEEQTFFDVEAISSGAVISLTEMNTYFSYVRGIFIDAKSFSAANKSYAVQVRNSDEVPTLGTKFFIFAESTISWPSSAGGEYFDARGENGKGFYELVTATLESQDGTYVLKCQTTPQKPDSATVQLYQPNSRGLCLPTRTAVQQVLG